MHRHAFAARDIADDFLSVQRITTAGAVDHEVFDAAHHDGIVAGNQALDRPHTSAQAGLFLFVEGLEFFGSDIFGNYVTGHDLAITDCRQEIVGAAIAILAGDALQVTITVT